MDVMLVFRFFQQKSDPFQCFYSNSNKYLVYKSINIVLAEFGFLSWSVKIEWLINDKIQNVRRSEWKKGTKVGATYHEQR